MKKKVISCETYELFDETSVIHANNLEDQKFDIRVHCIEWESALELIFIANA